MFVSIAVIFSIDVFRHIKSIQHIARAVQCHRFISPAKLSHTSEYKIYVVETQNKTCFYFLFRNNRGEKEVSAVQSNINYQLILNSEHMKLYISG